MNKDTFEKDSAAARSAIKQLYALTDKVGPAAQAVATLENSTASASELENARQCLAGLKTEIENTKKNLWSWHRYLIVVINRETDCLNIVAHGKPLIKITEAVPGYYQQANDATQKRINMASDLIKEIEAAINNAQRLLSGTSTTSRFRSNNGLDDIVADDTTPKFSAKNNYGLPLVMYKTIPLLDKQRYGNVINTGIEYIAPACNAKANGQSGGIGEKIRRGSGYCCTPPNSIDYKIKLPNYFNHVMQTGYWPQGGTYSPRS